MTTDQTIDVAIIGGGPAGYAAAIYAARANLTTTVLEQGMSGGQITTTNEIENYPGFVIGGGNSACEEALFLSDIASSVTIVLRRDQFRAPEGVVNKVLAKDNISVRYQTSIVELSGEATPTTITFKDNASGKTHTETFEPGSFGIFVFAGTQPHTELVEHLVDLGPDGGILTDESMATRTPGLFAAGDIRSKRLRQVVTAVSDGAIAATSAYAFLRA